MNVTIDNMKLFERDDAYSILCDFASGIAFVKALIKTKPNLQYFKTEDIKVLTMAIINNKKLKRDFFEIALVPKDKLVTDYVLDETINEFTKVILKYDNDKISLF